MSKKTRSEVEAPAEAPVAPPLEVPAEPSEPIVEASAAPLEVPVEPASPEIDLLLKEFYTRPAGVHPAALAYLYPEGLAKVVMFAEDLLERGEVRRLGELYQITPKGADRCGKLRAK